MKKATKWLLAIGGLCVLTVVGIIAWFTVLFVNAGTNTINDVTFDRELEIPPLAGSEVTDGVRTFDLTLQTGESDLGQRSPTPTWGINGPHLAPTLRAERGEQVQINVTNTLDEASTLHWHGMRLPAEMDGGPHQMIEPGDLWTPTWQIDQPAATLWFHPHPHGDTARHVYNGLAGMFILDDAEESELELPREYGVDDIPLIVQDRKFHDDGTLDDSRSLMHSAGIVGDTVLVNGTPGPYFEVTTETVRLRILNGSNTRPYNFAFEDNRTFAMIGSDGGLLEAPVELAEIQLSAGERAELVVTFNPGEHVRLRSGPSDTVDRFAGGTDRLEIIQFRVADKLTGLTEIPAELVDVPRITEASASASRNFRLSGFEINGQNMDMNRVDEVITAGDTEIWAVTNTDGATHNFHIHDVQFQILDIGGDEPPPHLRGWKDTVWLPVSQRVRLIMTFSDSNTSDEWAYMYHCHTLRHEDQGMMGQFLVVDSGQSTRPEDYRLQTDHDH